MYWWEKAAAQDQDGAQYYLGHCYMYGTHGLTKDIKAGRCTMTPC